MAGTTQYFGISYPTNTDYVKDGASNMQTIATGFDTAVAIPTYNNQTGTTYTFVLADAAKTVTSNNASAVTFTIPPQSSVAWATGTTLTIKNYGAGAITFAGGSGVTVTNTASTVAQYGSAKVVRTGSDAWTVLPDSGGASGALTLIKTQTIGSGVTSTAVTGAFSSTYDIYRILITGGANSGANVNLTLTLGATTTGYYRFTVYGVYSSNTVNGDAMQNGSTFICGKSSPNGHNAIIDISQPNAATRTIINSGGAGAETTFSSIWNQGYLNNSTQYTDFTISCDSGTITGGTIYVYGYQK